MQSGEALVSYTRVGTTATATETVGVSGTVFAPATLDLLGAPTLDLGLTHVGTTLTGALLVENAGTADGFTEKLDASLSGLGSGLTGSGPVSGVAPVPPGRST